MESIAGRTHVTDRPPLGDYDAQLAFAGVQKRVASSPSRQAAGCRTPGQAINRRLVLEHRTQFVRGCISHENRLVATADAM